MPRTTRSGSASASRISCTLIAAVVTFAGVAHAAPDCPTASEEGQRLRDKNRYLEAREMFRACSAQQCPKVVRSDCAKALAQLEESQPSIVIAAQDTNGHDLDGVRVQIDGRTVASRLDGSPIAVDPGEHSFDFASDGYPAIAQKLVIRVSEKNRLLRITFQAPVKEPPRETQAPKPQNPKPPEGGGGGAPVLAYILGGVGVLGLGSFAYFGLTSKKDLTDLRSSCAPYCEQGQLDDVKTKMLIADVSLGVGIVALGAATVLFLTHSSSPSAREVSSNSRR
jgi:hypothetical protein